MSVLKIKSKDFELELTGDSDAQLKQNCGTHDADNALCIALIAMALNDCGTPELHDRESGVITLKHTHSEWGSKILGLNKGIYKR